MRFKRLDIFGFKSFPQKTTIHFEPGVTAIVGPNGSGKTNLVDAVRWVLGEHNPRDVRAPRLEDVIFNGTDTKAPLSVAEVHLTIDNEQGLLPISFKEVTISRRVYRSGESECLINQAPCRLRDIQELFLGTGLGGGTYAIIEQGHIDLILSSKPEERRVVFEEASGVAKYLAKKKETMRRLDEVEEHLVRLADIMGEVRRQVKALERQATKARQYKTQWESLKQLELRLAADELRQGAGRYANLEQELKTFDAKRRELEQEKQARVNSLNASHAAVSAIQAQLQELQAKALTVSSQREQHASQAALKTRWVTELGRQMQQVEHEAEQLTSRIRQVEEQLARARGAEAELKAQEATIQTELGQSRGELDPLEETLRTAHSTFAEAKAQVFEAASEATQRRNALLDLEAKLRVLDAQLDRLETSRIQWAKRADDARAKQAEAIQERETLQATHHELERRAAAARQALEAAGASRQELTGRVHQVREQLASERARVKVLEAFWRHHEGFPEAVKTLMAQGISGVVGPLVDVVQAAPGFEQVVESALGPLGEAVVVRDRAAMIRCRDALRAKGLGECRFLVLADCPGAPKPLEPTTAGISGVVKQLVQTKPEYQALIDWLLDDSWIIEDFERLLRERGLPEQRLLSPQGDRWDRRSWRFNGAPAAAAAGETSPTKQLGRKQRWEQARAGVRTLEQIFSKLETQVKQAEQAWTACISQVESAKGELARMTPGLHTATARAAQLDQEVRDIAQEQQGVELESQELTAQRAGLRAKHQQARQAAEEAAARQQTIERAMAEAQGAREQAERRKQEILLARAQVEATNQSLAERLTAQSMRRQELEADRKHLLEQHEAKTLQRQEAQLRAQELKEQSQTHEQEQQALEAQRAQLAGQVEQVTRTLKEEEARRDAVVPDVMAVEQKLAALMPEVQGRSHQLSERQFRRERLIERLRELYQIDEATLDAEQRADAAPLTEPQRAELAGQVNGLRATLEGMGPVSLGSVEEYDELKRREEFLTTQHRDLVQSRDDLKQSISQINRTARSQFRETFEQIKQEFQHYFAKLFTGGQADVYLIDEDDVLESGIEIVARPPGKRLQSISLLSGGERALTATALLFALFKVRPSPFCILDEIDAPLDEANVDRFTKVLEEFLSLSQFILITHNKKTITKADCLYGVTMQEAGISKILSAKLTAGTTPSPKQRPTHA